ncbi:hypothetical protein V2J09_016495 [Rumex salicifolius]
MVPVQVAEQYFVIAPNIKNKNIHILDSAKEDRGKDYYREIVKKVARQYRHAYMHQRGDMIEAAASKPYLVPLPCKSNVEDEYTSGIYQCDTWKGIWALLLNNGKIK